LANAEKSVTGYHCEYEVTTPTKSESKRTRVIRRGDCMLLEYDRHKANKQLNNVSDLLKLCKNYDHMFVIMRPASHNEWSLVQFTRPEREIGFRKNLGFFRPMLCPLRAVGPVTTSEEDVENPTFHIHSVQLGPEGLFEAEFSVENVGENQVAAEGRLTVSARHEYAITQYSYTLSNDKLLRYKMTRTLSQPGEPIRCSLFRFEMVNAATGKLVDKQETRFFDYTTEPVAEELFTLEYYGIPTPSDGLPPIYARWKFWAVASAAAISVALLFRWLGRRPRQSRRV
jgi:hypothetical protein